MEETFSPSQDMTSMWAMVESYLGNKTLMETWIVIEESELV